jgi:hypothetical protein
MSALVSKALLLWLCLMGMAGGLVQAAGANQTSSRTQHREALCKSRRHHREKHRCRASRHAGKRDNRSPRVGAPKRPSKAPQQQQTPTPVVGPPPAGPPCPTPTLPPLPAGRGGSAIVGGIMWLSGGPTGTCESSTPTPLGGTIVVTNTQGATIATINVGEGEFFDISVPSGEYTVSGARYVPAPLEIGCGPPTSATAFAAGHTVTVSEGQATDIYCAGAIS